MRAALTAAVIARAVLIALGLALLGFGAAAALWERQAAKRRPPPKPTGTLTAGRGP